MYIELFFFDIAATNSSEEKMPKIDYAQTVLDLQEKLSRVACANQLPSSEISAIKNLATSSPAPSTTTTTGFWFTTYF